MAKGGAVWGIDIGQCALKALRCRPHEKEPRRLVVESFDYIEYPKILTQPEAEPAELIREALETFLSRNELVGDTVAMSVGGQNGLMRFIKLPPVEAKKIPDIVKYEARQQIPFSLDDVVWDYQQLTGGSEEDGFALEPEVGLFAMKRDQVARALAPLEAAGIEVDLIQLAPLSVYNYVCFDRFEEMKSQPYDPAKPPSSTVVISLGTDTTDLVVTNGFRVWQRNIPIGGNHFTRALSKELKLTFVKAEHLKRNATQADDPKAVFQAMRPVFSDLLAEIQRSLGYFQSLDKAAQIGEVIALGNAMKLPGLQRYLAQNLEQDVKPIEDFNRLTAGSAGSNAQYKENILSFGPAYGLCVQALGKSELKTNLLPEEIVRKRMIRAKKPWAVAGVAAVLAGLTFNYFTHVSSWRSADVTNRDDFKSAFSLAASTKTSADGLEAERASIKTAAEGLIKTQEQLTSNVEGRLEWLDLIKALDASLPRDPRPREENADHVMSRNELHITALDERHFADLAAEYITPVDAKYLESKNEDAVAAGDPAAAAGAPADAAGATADPAAGGAAAAPGEAPTGPGFVIQLTGYHYHNADQTNQTRKFVIDTLVKALEEGTVKLPDGYDEASKKLTGELVDVSLKDMGISRPWLVAGKPLKSEPIDPDAALMGDGGIGGGMPAGFGALAPAAPVAGAEGAAPGVDPALPVSKIFEVKRYDFVVQFCWQPKTRAERREAAAKRLAAEAEAAAAKAAAEAAASEQPAAQ
ncbi:pilus assembly protein PilM [Lacipirellula limnantheis]|uniref:Competence protein A n=1 Tax=Lacipirellula limnantheis TaxID=2528024 RepID=A0A517TUV5_9BACT|nr:pilus assembly protein PilM [Lacipirellula limnantheis]QDT72155.1 Competence protein A [Lacipirellula limnantheis]